MMPDVWHIYVLECHDGTFYTGITNNLERRLFEHNNTSRGAKYTRGRRPVQLIYSRECKSRSHALQEELSFKKLTKKQKIMIIDQGRS